MGYSDLDIQTGGKFLKIEMGKPVHVHILTPSEKIKREKSHYKDNKYLPCNGGACALCQDGLKQEERYVVEVFDRTDKQVKSFKFGPNIGIQIKEIASVLEMDNQTIHDVDLHISRISESPVRYQVVQRKMAGPVPTGLVKTNNAEDEDIPF